MKLLLFILLLSISGYCYSQYRNKPDSMAIVRTWKATHVLQQDSVIRINSPVPSNYQSTLPPQLTTEGIFTLFAPLLHQGENNVQPAPTESHP